MLYVKEEGVVIQIKPTGFRKGDKTKSLTIKGETVDIVFNRIKNIYEQLSKNDEVIIRHIK